MAAGVPSPQQRQHPLRLHHHHHHPRSPGRHVLDPYNSLLASPAAATYRPRSKSKSKLSTTTTATASSPPSALFMDHAAGPSPSLSSTPRSGLRATLRHRGEKDTARHAAAAGPPLARSSTAQSGRLHRRGGGSAASSSSLLPSGAATPTSFSGALPWPPFGTAAEPFPDVSSPSSPSSSTPKLNLYLRKLSVSSTKDDQNQGRLDLSKSVTENDALSGLGIYDAAPVSVSDVPSVPPRVRGHGHGHARSSSGASLVSSSAGSAAAVAAISSSSPSSVFRPNQPFVHPMKQTPQPYTPPTTDSSFFFQDEGEEEDNEGEGGPHHRPRRPFLPAAATTTTLSSLPPRYPSSTTTTTPAQDISERRHDDDSHDERVRRARRKFAAKEAARARKSEAEAAAAAAKKKKKKSKTTQSSRLHRRRSELSPVEPEKKEEKMTPLASVSLASFAVGDVRDDIRTGSGGDEKKGKREGGEEIVGEGREATVRPPLRTSWLRFSSWARTRMLVCGGGRA